jgi:endonuclease/exonuclease/phosphatase family metal-dependent hydrolase
MVIRQAVATVALAILAVTAAPGRAAAGQAEVAVNASDVTTLQGNWTKASAGDAAGGQFLSSADQGWSSTDAPVASPSHFFEANVNAAADTNYHIWLRLRATGNSKWNESVWVQFSDAVDQNGAAIYRIGSNSALLVNLENCSGCGVSGWGWQDGAYWLNQVRTIRFPSPGNHTIRVQTREDGAQIDQIVLSSSAYLSSAPGQRTGDNTIVADGQVTAQATAQATGTSAFSGSPAPIPGTIQAEAFDNGSEGSAYHDSGGSTNAGGAYRQTGVDIEGSTEGGYDVGWIAAGEWLNYTVNVANSGSYTANFRVASAGQGGTFHLELNGTNVSGAITVPNTGGWQSWTTVSRTVTLNGGQQVARLVFDSAGSTGAIGNLNWFSFTSASTPPPSSDGPTPYSGSPATVPGTIRAEAFDNGGEGVAYHDSGPNNVGGAVRQTGVDIESSSDGGYDVGWTAPGEWLNYSVNVTSSGSYTVQLRVASSGGATMRVGFNRSNVWQTVNVPSTGGWQSWATVSFPANLNAGQQLLTVLFDTGNVNLNNVKVVSGTTAPPPPPPPPPPSGQQQISVLTWNIQINQFTEAHAREAMANAIAVSPQPQVIAIQEAWVQFFDIYKDELQRRTGRTWYGAFQTFCAPGGWNGSCVTPFDQGVAIFSSFPIANSSGLYLPFADCWQSARAALRVALNVNGKILQVINTHLQTGGCSDVMSQRYASMSMIKSWAKNFSTPQIVAGDFNADPDQIASTQGMAPDFVESFAVIGSGSRFTFPVPTPTMKLDYWFFDQSWTTQPLSTEVVTSTGSVSDHRPVRATFLIP